MVDKISCEVDPDNLYSERRWICHYVFCVDPLHGTAVEKRCDDFIACVRNMFLVASVTYGLDTEAQRKFLTALCDNLNENLNVLVKEGEAHE